MTTAKEQEVEEHIYSTIDEEPAYEVMEGSSCKVRQRPANEVFALKQHPAADGAASRDKRRWKDA